MEKALPSTQDVSKMTVQVQQLFIIKEKKQLIKGIRKERPAIDLKMICNKVITVNDLGSKSHSICPATFRYLDITQIINCLD
jgi:hypothetical protein